MSVSYSANHEMVARFQNGDAAAASALLEQNRGLILKVAHWYAASAGSLAFEDLCQEGAIGMLRAAELFDFRRGTVFSTYATHWIRQAISRAVQHHSRTIRLPQDATEGPAVVASLDAPVTEEGATLGDAIPAPGDTEERIIAQVVARQLLAQLKPRDRRIIELRFGLADGEALSLRAVAAAVGLSHQAVRNIEVRALEELREAVK